MGLDAKLINVNTKQYISTDRKYKLSNEISNLKGLTDYLEGLGLPTYIMLDLIESNLLVNQYQDQYNYYNKLGQEVKKHKPHDYWVLSDDHDERFDQWELIKIEVDM